MGNDTKSVHRLHEAAERLPLVVAKELHALSKAPDELWHLYNTVEGLLRYTCLLVKSTYLLPGIPPNTQINTLIRRCLILPSMGSWQQFLKGSKPLIDGREIPLNVPGISPLLEALCSAETNEIVRYRNSIHGHGGAVPHQDTVRAVMEVAFPILCDLIEAATPLMEYPLVVFSEQSDTWHSMMGPSIDFTDPVESPRIEFDAPAAVMRLPDGDLPLFPLMVGTFDGFRPDVPMPQNVVLMFDGVDIDRKRLVYVGQYGRGKGKRWFDDYRILVEAKKIPMVPLKLDEVDSPTLLDRTNRAFEEVVEGESESGRYHGEVVRLDERVSGLLDDAVGSTARVVVVAGEAGSGKTTHLLELGLRAIGDGHTAFYIDAGIQLAEAKHAYSMQLRAAVESRLGILEKPEAILTRLQAAVPDGRRVLLILDGLDEMGSPARLRSRLLEITDWLSRNRDKLPSLLVVLAVRTAYYQAVQRLGDPLKRIDGEVYKTTRRSPSGADRAESVLWLSSAQLTEVGVRYEVFRSLTRGFRPLTEFKDLSSRIRQACRNPRWMMRLLQTYHGLAVPPLTGGMDLWVKSAREHVYALIDEGRPMFPRRFRIVDTLLMTQIASGQQEVAEDVVLANDSLTVIIKQDGHLEALDSLQSCGILKIEGDPKDPFSSSPLIRISEPGLASALHLCGPALRNADVGACKTLIESAKDSQMYPVLNDAVCEKIARDLIEPRKPNVWLKDLEPELAAMVLLRAAELGKDVLSYVYQEVPSDEGDQILRDTADLAWSSEQQSLLVQAGEALSQLPASEQTPTSVVCASRLLRHGELVDVAEEWLESLAESDLEIAPIARFQLAEILRDKGRWKQAIVHYSCYLEYPNIATSDRALALGTRGESHIWRQQAEPALADLDAALELVEEEEDPWVACNIHLKRGIARRLLKEPVRAVRELARAGELAREHHLRTEEAKIELELGLVADMLGGMEEAAKRVSRALEMHSRQGFIKGRKKALYCLGYIYEHGGEVEKARDAYLESLELNKTHYDLLGLMLNNFALARLSEEPRRSALLVEAQKYKEKLYLEDRVDGTLV